jgi:hypothetical protein
MPHARTSVNPIATYDASGSSAIACSSDNHVRLAHARGIPVYYGIADVPAYQGESVSVLI